jgi:hypothetical protein
VSGVERRAKLKAFFQRICHLVCRHTALHGEFQKIFETHLEEFVAGQGLSVDDFFRIVETDKRSEFKSGSTFAYVVNAAMSFQNFTMLMLDARKGEFAWGMPPLEDSSTGELYIG